MLQRGAGDGGLEVHGDGPGPSLSLAFYSHVLRRIRGDHSPSSKVMIITTITITITIMINPIFMFAFQPVRHEAADRRATHHYRIIEEEFLPSHVGSRVS